MKMILMLLVLLLLSLPAMAQDQGESALLLASASTASATYIQGAVGSNSAVNASAAAITVTAGDLIFAASKTQNTNAGGATIAFGSTGVTCTWSTTTPIDNFASGVYTSAVGWCVVPSSGSMTVTATWAGQSGTTFTDLGVAEFRSSSGFPASPLDVTVQTATTTSTTTCTSGTSATTSNGNDLVIAVCENWNTAQTYGAATPGYAFESASSRNTEGFYWNSVTATGTQSFTTTVASDQATGILVAFRLN